MGQPLACPQNGLPPIPGRQYNMVPPIRRIDFFAFRSVTLCSAFTGAQIASVFPVFKLMQEFQFTVDIGVTAISLASSVINKSAGLAGTAGIIIAPTFGLNVGQLRNYTDGQDAFIPHVALQNSTGTTIAPTTRNNSISFGEKSAVKFSTNQRIGIWMCAADSAVDLLTSICEVIYIDYTENAGF